MILVSNATRLGMGKFALVNGLRVHDLSAADVAGGTSPLDGLSLRLIMTIASARAV